MATVSEQRRERERTEVRTLILDAAREIMLNEGSDAVSMRRIADKIEYSPTALYVHFADKSALLAELCAQDFLLFAHQFAEAAGEDDPIERLRSVGRVYMKFAREYPHHYRLMFMVPMSTEDRRRIEEINADIKGNPSDDAYAFLKVCVAQAFDSGRVLPHHTDQPLVAQVMWAAMHGVVSLYIAKGNASWIDWRPVEEQGERVIDALLVWLTGEDASKSKKPRSKK